MKLDFIANDEQIQKLSEEEFESLLVSPIIILETENSGNIQVKPQEILKNHYNYLRAQNTTIKLIDLSIPINVEEEANNNNNNKYAQLEK